MDMPDYTQWFRGYAAAYERSLGERVDVAAIRACFAEGFVAASLQGPVQAGLNDEAFARTLQAAYGFYRAIGTRSMSVERVEVSPVCPNHDRVRVFYRAGYRKPDGSPLTIRFDVVYLLQRRGEGPKIYAFIAGDEIALYRQHGLVDEAGRPLPPQPARAEGQAAAGRPGQPGSTLAPRSVSSARSSERWQRDSSSQ
jgi:hypothetical protein